MGRLLRVLSVMMLLSTGGCLQTTDPGRSAPVAYGNAMPNRGAGSVAVANEEADSPSVLHQVAWYLPNRLLDFVDIFRARVRVGPGLSANARITDYADAFIGQYDTWYLGLPGPRMGPELGWFAGREREKGVKFLGVDASDDLDDEPDYSPTEINIGLQLLLVGAELGIDPVEIGDFLAGFILIDAREDDW